MLVLASWMWRSDAFSAYLNITEWFKTSGLNFLPWVSGISKLADFQWKFCIGSFTNKTCSDWRLTDWYLHILWSKIVLNFNHSLNTVKQNLLSVAAWNPQIQKLQRYQRVMSERITMLFVSVWYKTHNLSALAAEWFRATWRQLSPVLFQLATFIVPLLPSSLTVKSRHKCRKL